MRSSRSAKQHDGPDIPDQPYFAPEEASALKQMAIGPGEKTLAQVIEETLAEPLGRREHRGDFENCTAHDLAPVFERVFGINIKDLGKDKRFKVLTGEL